MYIYMCVCVCVCVCTTNDCAYHMKLQITDRNNFLSFISAMPKEYQVSFLRKKVF